MDEPKASFWQSCGGTERDRRNRRRVTMWNLIWGLSFIGATALIRFEVISPGFPSILACVASGALGIKVILAYRHYLLEADELQRKIEMDALAVAVGVGVFGGLTFWLLHLAGAFEEADLLVMPIIMMLTHGIGLWIGKRRYA